MGAQVDLQIRALGKPFTAETALEGFLSSMDAGVAVEVR